MKNLENIVENLQKSKIVQQRKRTEEYESKVIRTLSSKSKARAVKYSDTEQEGETRQDAEEAARSMAGMVEWLCLSQRMGPQVPSATGYRAK